MEQLQTENEDAGGQSRLTVRLEAVYTQKALSILLSLAQMAASGNSLTIAEDCGFGSATLIDQDGAHTHFGSDHCKNDQQCFEAFIDALHGLLVEKRGLSWVKPANVKLTGRGSGKLKNKTTL